MLAEHSLFASLHKWARQQDENYCTEGLIYILRLMLREAPTEAVDIIGWLTDDLIGADTPAILIAISSQVSGEEGRPDIIITSGLKTAIIEVKVGSPVEATQLQRYRTMLAKRTGQGRLILLSRGNDVLAEGNRPDCTRRWIELSFRLQQSLRSFGSRTSKIAIVLEDYLAFLATKQMKLNGVSKMIAESIKDVGSLLSQIKLACESVGLKVKWNKTGDGAIGYSVLEKGAYVGWIGFNVSEPQYLFYTTEGVPDESRIDPDLAQKCDLPGSCVVDTHWTNSIDLSECTDYLSESPAEQVNYLRLHLVENSLRAFRAMLRA